MATSPNTRAVWNPSRLYTLTLSARARHAPNPAGRRSLPVQLGSLAADADGGVIAFSGQRSSRAFVVGVVIGNQVKQWSVSEREASIENVSVTSAGTSRIHYPVHGPGSHFAAMVLATGSAPGSLLTRPDVGSYDYPRKDLYMFAVAISPDANWVYIVTRPILPFAAKLPTTLTAYSSSRQGAPVTIAASSAGSRKSGHRSQRDSQGTTGRSLGAEQIRPPTETRAPDRRGGCGAAEGQYSARLVTGPTRRPGRRTWCSPAQSLTVQDPRR